jgi:glycosyltransferase involved in cell wall biosynthesis
MLRFPPPYRAGLELLKRRATGGYSAMTRSTLPQGFTAPGTTIKASHSTPLVSVVMPVFDPRPDYLRQAAGSILRQTFSDLELIIVEDPGPRSAAEVVAELDDPRVRYYPTPQRTSLIDQRNRGLAKARAELVALLDADDVAEPDRLRKQIDYLHAHPDITVLGSQIHVIDESGLPLGYRFYPMDHESIVSALRLFNSVSQPSVIFRKTPVVEAGGYRYGKHRAEDYELWCRLARRGLRFANYPEPLIRYRIHPEQSKIAQLRSTIRGTLEVKRMYWRNRMDGKALARLWGERLLLWLPTWFVLRLFIKTQYTPHGPVGTAGGHSALPTGPERSWKEFGGGSEGAATVGLEQRLQLVQPK